HFLHNPQRVLKILDKSVETLFAESVPEVIDTFISDDADKVLSHRTDEHGIELMETDGAARKIFLFPARVLPDWTVISPDREKPALVARVEFSHLLNSLKNKQSQPVAVCFPWKPSTTKMPKVVAEQFEWRSQNGKPLFTFLTPAAMLCALTLI